MELKDNMMFRYRNRNNDLKESRVIRADWKSKTKCDVLFLLLGSGCVSVAVVDKGEYCEVLGGCGGRLLPW